jgi:hypothetical protein
MDVRKLSLGLALSAPDLVPDRPSLHVLCAGVRPVSPQPVLHAPKRLSNLAQAPRSAASGSTPRCRRGSPQRRGVAHLLFLPLRALQRGPPTPRAPPRRSCRHRLRIRPVEAHAGRPRLEFLGRFSAGSASATPSSVRPPRSRAFCTSQARVCSSAVRVSPSRRHAVPRHHLVRDALRHVGEVEEPRLLRYPRMVDRPAAAGRRAPPSAPPSPPWRWRPQPRRPPRSCRAR